MQSRRSLTAMGALAVAAAMGATAMPSYGSGFQMPRVRTGRMKTGDTPEDLEALAKAEAKRARKAAKLRGSKCE